MNFYKAYILEFLLMHNFFHLIIEYFYRPIYRALELKMFLTLPVIISCAPDILSRDQRQQHKVPQHGETYEPDQESDQVSQNFFVLCSHIYIDS